MTDMVDRIADIMIEDHVELMKENKALEAEIERLKDMEQAYLEEVKLRLELEVEIERLTNRIAYLQHEMKRHLPILETLYANAYEWETCAAGTGVATLNGYRAALAGKEPPQP